MRKPKHVVIIKNRLGASYAYYRRNGAMTAIKAPDRSPLLPGEPGFTDAYNALHAAHRVPLPAIPERPADTSLRTLVKSYLSSDEFAAKAPTTQIEYTRVANEIAAAFGDKSAATLELPHVHRIRDKLGGRAQPFRANKTVAILSVLMQHARSLGWRKDNPALRPGKLPTNSDGYRMWTAENYRDFQDSKAPAEVKLAVTLAYYTGLRVGDLVALRRLDWFEGGDGVVGAIHVVTGKTGAEAHIPIHPDLEDGLAAAGTVYLLETEPGVPWSLDGLKHALQRAVAAAGLPEGLSFHGLRKGLTAALVEHGASDAEVEAIIPHADPRMTKHYRKQADQRKLAQAGMARLAATQQRTA